MIEKSKKIITINNCKQGNKYFLQKRAVKKTINLS